MAKTQQLKDYSIAELTADVGTYLEKRMSYSGDNLEYVGYNREPNAATTDTTWFIIKMTYSGSNVTRYQLPDNGVEFKYAWDSRATYFT